MVACHAHRGSARPLESLPEYADQTEIWRRIAVRWREPPSALMVRVPPFRGDQVAAGVVVLTALVVLMQVRMGWEAGGHLALAVAAVATVGVLVAGCPREPRPYVSAIVTSGLVLLALVLVRLGQMLGVDGLVGGAGPLTWKLVALGLMAGMLAHVYDAAAATLVAGLSLAFSPLALFSWVIDPSPAVQRLLLLITALGLALAATSRRDRRPAHAAQLANAGGIVLAAIGFGPLVAGLGVAITNIGAPPGGGLIGAVGDGIGWGWELPMLVGAFGLLAYGAVDRQRGPVLVGLLALASWIASAAGDGRGSLLGWPLLLAVAAVLMLGVGLRPTTPAPPPPPDGDPEQSPPPPLPLR